MPQGNLGRKRRRTAVLPLRFDVVLVSEDAVAQELPAANHGRFADALSQLAGPGAVRR
jgi:hypothetical protein